MSKKDDYVSKMKAQLDELNDEMNVIEAKARDAKQEARAKYEEQMEKVRLQSKLASAKLDEVKSAAEDGWDKMVDEMDRLRAAFVNSFRYFKSQV